jgi:tripartite motif-containing protein 71
VNRRDFVSLAATVLITKQRADAAESETSLETSRKPRLVTTWGKKGSGEGELDSPIGLAISRKDDIYVADFKNSRVQKFDSNGKLLQVIPTAKEPGGIAVARDGRIYVGHFGYASGREHIRCFSPQGELLYDWGKTGKGDGEFDSTGGLAVGKDGTVYVADQTNRRVQRFTAEGRFLMKWGHYGSLPGQFDGVANPKARTGGPQMVAVDNEGYVWTTEGKLCRIQRFTADGRFDRCWGSAGTEPGAFGGHKQLPGPIGICFDRNGYVWVSATNSRVQQFNSHGVFQQGIGTDGYGNEPGRFSIPHGIGVDSKNNLYVVDSHNARVQKFAL